MCDWRCPAGTMEAKAKLRKQYRYVFAPYGILADPFYIIVIMAKSAISAALAKLWDLRCQIHFQKFFSNAQRKRLPFCSTDAPTSMVSSGLSIPPATPDSAP